MKDFRSLFSVFGEDMVEHVDYETNVLLGQGRTIIKLSSTVQQPIPGLTPNILVLCRGLLIQCSGLMSSPITPFQARSTTSSFFTWITFTHTNEVTRQLWSIQRDFSGNSLYRLRDRPPSMKYLRIILKYNYVSKAQLIAKEVSIIWT